MTLLTTASSAASPAFRENRFLHWMCAGVLAAILISAYRPETAFDWALENTLVFCFVVTLAATYRRFVFSDLSYLLIFVFLCFHEWGAHYKYSDVPLGEWMKPWLHTHRNHFDRISHFSFGLFFSYPMQEIALRVLRATGRWRYYLPVECTLALSAVYEIMEAGMAGILTPERGEEFVGMQGDMWDSQKDMFVAVIGSMVALLAIYVVRKRRTREAAHELAAAYAAGAK